MAISDFFTVFGYYGFVKGFLLGIAVRLIIAILFKSQSSFGGFVRTGIFFGIVNIILVTLEVI
jgi:hypothetical protein